MSLSFKSINFMNAALKRCKIFLNALSSASHLTPYSHILEMKTNKLRQYLAAEPLLNSALCKIDISLIPLPFMQLRTVCGNVA